MYFSSIILTDLIDYAVLKGMDQAEIESQLLVANQIDLTIQKHISYDIMVASLNFIGQALNDEYLGLHIGEQISLKVTAYVDSIMNYSPSLEAAFNNAIAYSQLISDALECSLSKKDNRYIVRFEENPNWKIHQADAKRQILDLTLLSTFKSLIVYTNRKYPPIFVNFNFEKPKNIKDYFRIFNCRLNFNQDQSSIAFEKQIFEKHHKNNEPGLLQSLKQKVEVEIQNLNKESEIIYLLKKAILNYKPDRITIQQASTQLNMSPRTLQRKLKVLHTSFKKVEYELQLKLSKTYLEENNKNIDEISYLLGFSESSAFIRFFKSQTKQSPLAYKKSLQLM